MQPWSAATDLQECILSTGMKTGGHEPERFDPCSRDLGDGGAGRAEEPESRRVRRGARDEALQARGAERVRARQQLGTRHRVAAERAAQELCVHVRRQRRRHGSSVGMKSRVHYVKQPPNSCRFYVVFIVSGR